MVKKWFFSFIAVGCSVLSIMLLLLIILSGCSNSSINAEERKAAEIILSNGYGITVHLGEGESYTLDHQKLLQAPYMSIWSLQDADPANYVGKTITSHGFVVAEHPLEQLYASVIEKKEYEVHLYIIMAEGEVIGGYSFPAAEEDEALIMGGFYSMYGRTQEEITGLSYVEWLQQWNMKYRNDSST